MEIRWNKTGTQLVEDINPSSLSSAPENFTPTLSKLYFTCYHPNFGAELWVLDNGSTNIAETNLEDFNLSVFPNPADKFTMANLSDVNFENLYLEVFTVSGTPIDQKASISVSVYYRCFRSAKWNVFNETLLF